MGDQDGIRGPRGPRNAPHQRQGSPQGSSGRSALEEWSYPVLTRLTAAPRWLLVVLLASIFVVGLIQTGSLAWIGTILLLVVAAFLGWLLALAWPVLTPGRRFFRGLTVAAIVGIAIVKLFGYF